MKYFYIYIFYFFFLACTAIVKSSLDEPSDATVEDMWADTEPDFDPENCGMWGRLYLEKSENVPVNSQNDNLNAIGSAVIVIDRYSDTNGWQEKRLDLSEVDLNKPYYYCFPYDKLSGITEGFVMGAFIDPPDPVSAYERNQLIQFRYIYSDPLVIYLILLKTLYPQNDYSIDTSLYWKGANSTNFDIPFIIRASRIKIRVNFSDFNSGISLADPRICVSYYGITDGAKYPVYPIGLSYRDIEATEINIGSIDLEGNIVVKKNQRIKVLAVLARKRLSSAADEDPCDVSFYQTCDFKCFTFSANPGEVQDETSNPFIIKPPIANPCSYNMNSSCNDQ